MKIRKTIPYVEILIGFFVIDCINYVFFPGEPAFLKWPLSPYWIVVLLAAARYGWGTGLFSGLLAALHIGKFLFNDIPSKSEIEKLLESQGLVLPAAFIFTGLILGEIREKYKTQEAEARHQLKDREHVLKLVKEKAQAAETAYRLLEKRIVGESTTVKMLYDTAQRFERLETDEIYMGCLEMLTKHLQVEKSSIYLLEGSYFVLAKSQGWGAGEMAEAKVLRQNTLMDFAVREERLVTVRDFLRKGDVQTQMLEDGTVLASVPLRRGPENIVGVVNIGKIDFLAFHEANLNLFKIIVEWTGQALAKAIYYQKSRHDQIFDESFSVYSLHCFEFLYPKEFEKARCFHLPLSVAAIKVERLGFFSETTQDLLSRGLIALLKQHLPQTGMIFRYRFAGSFLLMVPMQMKAEILACLKTTAELFLQEMTPQMLDKTPRVLYAVEDQSGDFSDAQEFLKSVLKKTSLVTR